MNIFSLSKPKTFARCQLPFWGVLLVLLSTAVLIMHPYMDLTFAGDDTYLIETASQHSISELLFHSPGRLISKDNYMPILAIFFRMDWCLFGLNFLGYNLHTTLWMFLSGLGAYTLFRSLGASRINGMLSGILLMIAPATISTAGHFSNRHYLAGLALCLFSLSAFMQADKGNRRARMLLSAFLYFIAICCKEPYVMLPVFVILLSPRHRFRLRSEFWYYSVPFLLYIGLRWGTLGTPVGGYQNGNSPASMIYHLFLSLPRFLETLFYVGSPIGQINTTAALCGLALLIVSACLFSISGGWKATVGYIIAIGASLSIVGLILGNPIILYSDDFHLAHGDRLALAFSTTAWLSLTYALLKTPWLSDRKIAFILSLLSCALFACNRTTPQQQWQEYRLSTNQVQFINEHLSEEIEVISGRYTFLEGYVGLLKRQGKDVKLTVWSPDTPPNNKPFYKVVPRESISIARNSAEKQEWIGKYGRDIRREIWEKKRR